VSPSSSESEQLKTELGKKNTAIIQEKRSQKLTEE
jgi:hypothetical protein